MFNFSNGEFSVFFLFHYTVLLWLEIKVVDDCFAHNIRVILRNRQRDQHIHTGIFKNAHFLTEKEEDKV